MRESPEAKLEEGFGERSGEIKGQLGVRKMRGPTLCTAE
jgi:hypothetical protein